MMVAPTTQYVIDEKGKKKAVVLDIKEYTRLLRRLEELEDALALGQGGTESVQLPRLP
ncbi:MAG: hypothetical protein HYX97_04330 [Chloroflexi bacterium]|nr:hypothetical protein [Chloroflexota bacterium]